MNYKRLLKKITHKNFTGGAFPYCKCEVNVTMGAECMDVHITEGNRTVCEFDFTFEIPRDLVFHNMCKRTSNCIIKNLEAIYNSKIPAYYES